MRSAQRSCRQRGFNLIEVAIVLGVIGLVIGGIWVAASAISQRQKVNDISVLATRLLAYYQQNPLAGPPAQTGGNVDSRDITALVAVQTPQVGSFVFDQANSVYTDSQGLMVAGRVYATGPSQSCSSCRLLTLSIEAYTDSTFTTAKVMPAFCSAISGILLQNKENIVDANGWGMFWFDTSWSQVGQWRPSLGAAPDFVTYGSWCANAAGLRADYLR